MCVRTIQKLSKVIFCIYIWQIFDSAGKSDRHRSKTLSEKYSFLGRNFYKGKNSTSKAFSFKSTVPRDFVIYMFSTTVHTYLSHKCIYCMYVVPQSKSKKVHTLF